MKDRDTPPGGQDGRPASPASGPPWSAWRRLRDRARLLAAYFEPRTLILRRPSNALGDNLMLTAVAREIRKASPGVRIVVETPFPEIFFNNPHVSLAVDGHFKTTRRHLKPKYFLSPDCWSAHVLDQLFAQIPISVSNPERRVEIFFTPEEDRHYRKKFPQGGVAVCPVGKMSHSADRKEWGFDRFQAVVDALPEVFFAQIGSKEPPLLSGVADFRGLPVRESAGVLAGSRLFLGLEGGLMHLANAVRRPAVIIYGGAVHPSSSAYADHRVISRRPECSPCFTSHERMSPCPNSLKCLKEVTVEEVCREVKRLLERQVTGLEGERIARGNHEE